MFSPTDPSGSLPRSGSSSRLSASLSVGQSGGDRQWTGGEESRVFRTGEELRGVGRIAGNEDVTAGGGLDGFVAPCAPFEDDW